MSSLKVLPHTFPVDLRQSIDLEQFFASSTFLTEPYTEYTEEYPEHTADSPDEARNKPRLPHEILSYSACLRT